MDESLFAWDEAAYRWFTRWLQGKENMEPEAPVALATAEELQCTSTGQVKTSFPGATDVFTMNRKLAEQLRGKRSPTPDSVRQRAAELTYYSPRTGPPAVTSYGVVTRPAYRAE